MTTALAMGSFQGLRARRGGTGVSAASEALDRLFVVVLRHLNSPATLSEPLRGLLENLGEIYERCSQPGWDGYGAVPITEATYEEARELITLFPTLCPPPDVTPDPSGHVSFEWYRNPRRVLVVSVNGTRVITYARLFGSGRLSGAEPYDKSLPEPVVDSLARLYSQQHQTESVAMPVDPNEELARFAVEKSYYRADNSVRPNAFMPDPRKTVSVFRQSGFSESEIWELGITHVATPRNKPLLGRAVIHAHHVFSQELSVEAVEPPPRHANILGWPDEHEKQKEKALELAARATFVRR